jgi:hypothetical protein
MATPLSPASAMQLAAVLASLPVSVQPAVAGGTLVAIDGLPGWGRHLRDALSGGAQGIFVMEPSQVAEFELAEIAELADRAASQRVPVVLDTGWAQNPAVGLAAEGFQDRANEQRIVEANVVARPTTRLGTVLVAQLALVRAAVGAVTALVPSVVDAHGYSILGSVDSGTRVSLAATLTRALPETATLRILGQQGSITLELRDQTSALPGRVTITGPTGATQLPTLFESGHRAAWRRLHAAVLEKRPSHDLTGFIADARAAARAIPE